MPITKSPSWAPEFAQFIEDSRKVAYADLARHWADGPYKYRLIQRATHAGADGSVIIDTDLHIGPSIERLEYFDTLTIKMPPNIAPVTLLVRQNMTASLIAVVFGRWPDAPAVATQPSQAPIVPPVHVNGHSEPDGGEYLSEPETRPMVDVITRREPDGLPIFKDLFALGDKTGDVLDAVLEEVGSFLKSADSIEQVMALAIKNPDMMAFVKDLGDEQDRTELKAMVDQRRRELTIPAAAAAANAPRRRVRASNVN